jgi:hypothetical protein
MAITRLSLVQCVRVLCMAWCGSSCSEHASQPAEVPAKLYAIEQRILTPSCALSGSCHSGRTPHADLNLEDSVYAKIVGVPATEAVSRVLIVPGNVEDSYLLEKISSVAPKSGTQMPPGQPLPAAEIDAIRRWILAGANND